MPVSRVLVAAILIATMGCTHQRGGTDPAVPPPITRDSDVITAQELEDPSVRGDNALDAVRRLRPRFLASRGRQTINAGSGTLLVSTNGGPLRGLSDLSRLRSHEVAEIRYLSPSDAAQRFGTAAGSSPVLLVTSK